MAYDHEWPYSSLERANIDWAINTVKKLEKEMKEFTGYNQIVFADPIDWSATTYYKRFTIVLYTDGCSYISKVDVPVGIPPADDRYWAKIADYNAQVEQLRLAVEYLQKGVDYVTPEQYGAVGDGVTDDYEALQAAINSGFNVRLLRKVYKCNTGLVINNAMVLTGTLDNTTEVMHSAIDMSEIEDATAISIASANVEINNVFITGNDSCNGIHVYNLSRVHISGANIVHCGIGINFDRVWNSTIDKSTIRFCTTGISFTGVCTSIGIYNTIVYSCDNGLVSNNELDYSTMVASGFDHCDTAITLENGIANGLTICNVGFEDYIIGAYVKGNAHITVIGCTCVNTERSVETFKGAGSVTYIGDRVDALLLPTKADVKFIGTFRTNAGLNRVTPFFNYNNKTMTDFGTAGGLIDYLTNKLNGDTLKITFEDSGEFDFEVSIASTDYPEVFHITRHGAQVALTQETHRNFSYVISTNDITLTFSRNCNLHVKGYGKYGVAIA